MKKKSPSTSSLLAARPHVLRRRPPKQSAAPESLDTPEPPNLRVFIGDESASSEITHPQAETGTEGANGEARLAHVALCGICALLQDVLDALRPVDRPRRWSPRQVAEHQALVDRVVRDVDRIVQNTTSHGRKLLDGHWSARAAADRNGASPRLPLRSMSPDQLGPDMRRTLDALRTGGVCSLLVTSVEDAREVIGCALAQTAMERCRLVNFAGRGALAPPASAEIADENQLASHAAVSDDDLVDVVGRLTPGHLLACGVPAPPQVDAPPSSILSVIHPPQD